tara:strand:- start:311 stop:514 length:204 start_codon:yes stop_codon:yes gene_type:complete
LGVFFQKLFNIMNDHNSKNQEDLILKLDQDRAWLLENLDKGKWLEIRSELADLERKISKLIIRIQES